MYTFLSRKVNAEKRILKCLIHGIPPFFVAPLSDGSHLRVQAENLLMTIL